MGRGEQGGPRWLFCQCCFTQYGLLAPSPHSPVSLSTAGGEGGTAFIHIVSKGGELGAGKEHST